MSRGRAKKGRSNHNGLVVVAFGKVCKFSNFSNSTLFVSLCVDSNFKYIVSID